MRAGNFYYLFIIVGNIIGILSCGENSVDFKNVKNSIINRELPDIEKRKEVDSKLGFINDKFKKLVERRQNQVYLFDFGSNLSPYYENSIVVTPVNRSIYHRWINNFNCIDADQKLINPIFTDFIMGAEGNEILFNIHSGEYEITFISGSEKSDVLPFEVNINGEEYIIYSREFKDYASIKGNYAFNTIDRKIKVEDGIIRIKFLNKWLVNAIIINSVMNFEVKRYSKLPTFEYVSDFYYLLSRENAVKWSKKFGYDYEKNWDYVIEKADSILANAGAINFDKFSKVKFIADYVDRLTRETCCEVPEIDILNSPVDILDPDGYKKGSCFGLARLVGVLANSYGLPARLVGYFIDSDLAPFPSLFPQISSSLFAIRSNFPYSTFALGGYNHTEVEVFYNGKWRLITNYQFEDSLSEYSAVEVVNNKNIYSFKRTFYDNVQDIMFLNLFIANINRQPDYCELPYSCAFYDLDTARSLYPENIEWTFKTDNHLVALNSLKIGRFWSIRNTLQLQYNWVKMIGRELFVPKIEDEEEVILNLIISESNRNIEENLNIYVNGIKIDYVMYDRIKNFNFQDRDGGVFQLRVKIDKDRILQQRLNTFDVELKDNNSNVSVVIGKNDNRVSGYDVFTMDYCNKWDMMKSSNSYYYYGSNRYPLYNNPLLFLEIVKK